MKKSENVTARQVIDALEQRLWMGDAFAWFREVRNQTGYSRVERRADALVVSCWPSRGIYASGVEVKVDRQDWLKELKTPEKSAEIQRFCKHWWLATTPGLVREGELPATWGLIEVGSGKPKVVVPAPTLEYEQPTWTFVASVLRDASKQLASIRQLGVVEGMERAEKKSAEDAEAFKEAAQKAKQYDQVCREMARLRESVDEFQKATGLCIGGWRAVTRSEKILRLASRLENVNVDDYARELDSRARTLQETAGVLREMKGLVDERPAL